MAQLPSRESGGPSVTNHKYEMTISLNVLNHLGLNLYSNIPAVLSEVVANSYDADASRVDITIDPKAGTVTIQDDGHGMTREQVNGRFLNVGYERREDGAMRTSPGGRAVMGRKGIGKLSLFSVANEVEVYTIRDGECSALRMTVAGIKAALKNPSREPYHPEELPEEGVDFHKGTKIVLRSLKKGLSRTAGGLRTRLARRFSILGAEQGFQLFIGTNEVTIEDRDYFHKLEYAWVFGGDAYADAVAEQCANATSFKRGAISITPLQLPEDDELGDGVVVADKAVEVDGDEPTRFPITGWIGTAKSVSALRDPDTKDNLNKVSLVMRGKVAHEDLLEEFNENGLYASYLIGEIRADFLDEDDLEDIATSSRQRIIEDDPRYAGLMKWLRAEISRIGADWLELRNQKGRDTALDNPLIAEWFKSLGKNTKKKAERLFGKINQLTIDDPKERNELFAQAVLGFETLRYRDNLDSLDELDAQDLQKFVKLFGDISDIQAAMYHQTVQQRLEVINKLMENVDANVLEKVLQAQLFENLWLLDPGWERATDRSMEERVGKAFAKVEASLSDDEKQSRMDIRYRRTGGINVIVELKRANVRLDTNKLLTQVDKYRNALREYLRATGASESFETVCVLGSEPTDWADRESRQEKQDMLKRANIRVVQYEKLLADAQAAYRDYLDKQVEIGHIQKLVMELAAQVGDDDSGSVDTGDEEAEAA